MPSSQAAVGDPSSSRPRPTTAPASTGARAGPSAIASATRKHSLPSGQLPSASAEQWTPVGFFRSGMFAGRYMSFWLEVAQEPVHGRRKTEKDRRPLAPSPIVRLWIRKHDSVDGPGSLMDPSDIEVSHLVCAADLRPSHSAAAAAGQSESRDSPSPGPSGRARTPSPARLAEGYAKRSPPSSASPPSGPRDREGRYIEDHDAARMPRSTSRSREHRPTGGDDILDTEGSSSGARRPTPGASSASRPSSRGSEGSRGRPRSRRVARSEPLGDRPGSSHVTGASGSGDIARHQPQGGRNLYGNLHVAGIRVAAPEGGLGLWFLFTDLCIRNEGSYSLRFRCFDMTAISPDSDPMPPLVDCQSADFKVYSPRNFPGLPKPTELADHFARQGYKLNTRKNERQAASPVSPPATAAPAAPSLGKASHTESA